MHVRMYVCVVRSDTGTTTSTSTTTPITTTKRTALLDLFTHDPDDFVDVILADINECLSDPCMNNATCLDLVAGYTCNCPDNTTGLHCQEGERCLLLFIHCFRVLHVAFYVFFITCYFCIHA